ncbi:MAG: cupin domain-containing protein [Agarilytica sp.]
MKHFSPLTQLGDISLETFFTDYWQKKPLLIRQAFPNFSSLISPDELAGLSLEEDVESRLIIENKHQWQVEHGPLEEERFNTLPEHHWTLLVQHVDSLDPQINALLKAFRFIPNWRLDDIMISYASDGGGVGPHFDYYDVFLLQAEGERRWRLGQECSSESPLIPDQAMKILQDFSTEEDWVLSPGDMLYVPAKKAHWGEAVGECMTYSIGFRAPSHTDFLLDFSQEAASTFSEDLRYSDPILHPGNDIGKIGDEVIQHFQLILQDLSHDKNAIASWLAQYATELKQPVDTMFDALIPSKLETNHHCKLSEYCRVSYFTDSQKCVTCFINGQPWQCSEKLAQMLSQYQEINYTNLDAADKKILRSLAEEGLLNQA